ncbi:hypothetical protein HanRHA438_Chr16g0774131 [Helianthus annuus]|nr:hypothetical protein HanRHA438_Chr16g0774131 [Helianthus annuus]
MIRGSVVRCRSSMRGSIVMVASIQGSSVDKLCFAPFPLSTYTIFSSRCLLPAPLLASSLLCGGPFFISAPGGTAYPPLQSTQFTSSTDSNRWYHGRFPCNIHSTY